MNHKDQSHKQAVRNLVIFTIAALSIGWLGSILDKVIDTSDPQQGLGILLWILVPAGTGLLLRAFGGDGWQDAGLKPNLKPGLVWYVAALLIFPIISLLIFSLGSAFGAYDLPQSATQGVGSFISLTAVSFASVFIKNIFEEFAWRGYLTGRFETLKLNPLINHLLTGLIWAGWHIPYWLYFVNVQEYTSLSKPAFITIGIFALVTSSITYGELRLLSKSVWTAVILHSMANAVTATLLLDGFIKPNGTPGIMFSPGNDGIIHIILFAVVGIGLYQYRMKNMPHA